MRKMRIGLITHLPLWPFSGGSSFRVYRYVKELCKRHEVHAIAPLDKSVSLQDVKKQFGPNLRLHPFTLFEVSRFAKSKEARYSLFALLTILPLIKIHEKNKLDAVIVHNSICALPAIILKKIFRVPYVLDTVDIVTGYSERMSSSRIRNFFFRALFKSFFFRIEKKFAKEADRVIAITEELAKTLGVKSYAVVHDGVDLKKFNPGISGREIRKRLKLGGKRVVIFTSILDPCQNPEIIVHAAGYAIKKIPNIRFMLTGKGTSVPALKRLIKAKKLEEHFIFTGWIPSEKFVKYLAAAELGLVTHPATISAQVMFPIKLSEYWAMEKPAVVSDLPQLRKVVKDYENGFLFNPSSAKDLADKIVLAFSQGAAKMRKMGRNGRKLVERDYDWDKASRQFVKEVEDLRFCKVREG
jgi:glycosyltransferase involved in cell wall biosynthesis